MIKILRADSDHTDFVALVRFLDAELAIRDGADHAFYSQYNKIGKIRQTVIAYHDGVPVGCGAIKEYDKSAMEVKRMYVADAHRSKGIASAMLSELETWAKELGYTKCLLETGKRQPEAIALYKKNGYAITANYGQYIGIDNSVCFEKSISH